MLVRVLAWLAATNLLVAPPPSAATGRASTSPTAGMTALAWAPAGPDSAAERRPAPAAGRRRSRAEIAGITIAALTVVPLTMFVTGLALGAKAQDDFNAGPTRAERDDAEDLGRVANNLVIAGGLTAAIMAGVSAALIAVRPKSEHSHRDRRRRTAFHGGPGGLTLRF